MDYTTGIISWNAVLLLGAALAVLFYLIILNKSKYRMPLTLLVLIGVSSLLLSNTLTINTCPACAGPDSEDIRADWCDRAKSAGLSCCDGESPQSTRHRIAVFEETGEKLGCRDRDGDGEDSSDEEDKYADAYSKAEAGRKAWESIQRAKCDANQGVLFDMDVHYCNGFMDVSEFPTPVIHMFPAYVFTFPEFAATSGCCIGSLLSTNLTVEEAREIIVAGTTDDYEGLLQSRMIDERTIITDENDVSKVCFTTTYLCTNTIFEDGPLTVDMYCDPTNLVYCPYGCDFDTADCFGESSNVTRDEERRLINHPNESAGIDKWMLAGIFILIIAIVLLLVLQRKWQPK